MKDFENARTFRKSNGELARALRSPEKAREMMIEAHSNGEIPKGARGDDLSIRIMGDVKEALELVQKLGLEDKVSVIYKNYRDKDKREEIDPLNIRIYINL